MLQEYSHCCTHSPYFIWQRRSATSALEVYPSVCVTGLQLAEFLLRDDISRPSSCRSVVIDGKECPVGYWQSSIKEVIQHYLLEFPGNVKRSYIYAHIPKNFRSNTMLAGLCNLCEDYGYSNFANLKAFVQKLGADCPQQEFGGTVKKIINRSSKIPQDKIFT